MCRHHSACMFVVIMAGWLASQVAVAAGDWPTVHCDAQRSGFTADSVRGPYRLTWVSEFPGESVATRVEPIVAAGRVYVGTLHGTLWALDRATGTAAWTHPADGPILHSPAFADGRVFFGDAGGTLHAVDAATGRPLWRFRSRTGGFAASPLVANGVVYLGSRDGTFYAVDAGSGELRWRFETGGPIRGTAALAKGKVLFASDDMFAYALDARTGQLVWKSDRLFGQSFRDYYPVVVGETAVFRSVLVEEMNDDLNGGTAFLQRLAGVEGGWRELEAFFKSDRNRGTPELIHAEQSAIRQRLDENPYRRTCFVLDLETGRESARAPVMYIAGNQGSGIPPVLTADGRPIVFYRTVYSNWNLGVKPAVGLGYLDVLSGDITPIRHREGHTPPWNTFWGTCDETTTFSVGGDLLYISHQGTLSALDLKFGRLFPIYGERDTWGGLLAPIWASNEWHGPARGSAAICDNQLFWITGSRVLCIGGNETPPPEDQEPRRKIGGAPPDGEAVAHFTPSTGFIDAARLIGEQFRTGPVPADVGAELHTKLIAEVQELLDGWPWAPFYLQMGIGSRDFYFAHPSYAVQALALAYPHLPQDLAERARARAAAELPACLNADALPLDRGRRRELYGVPPHALSWSYHPRWPAISHVYAIWLYGERTGDWETVEPLWPQIRAVWEQYTAQPLQIDETQGPQLYVNRTLAGCIAYGRLAARFGADAGPVVEEVERLLNLALASYRRMGALAAQTLQRPTSRGDTHHNPGRKFYFHLNNHKSKLAVFLDLTPELGRALAEAAPPETAALKLLVDRLMPAFYLAFEERSVHYGENFVDLPDSVHGLFLAKAFLWNAPVDRLAAYTDLPWVAADLFHIEKLVYAIEAHRERGWTAP